MAWTLVPKPTESSVTTGSSQEAQPFGLLIAITSVMGGGGTSSITSGWGSISKPTSSLWTVVAEPTTASWVTVAKPTIASWSGVSKPTVASWISVPKPT